MTESTLLKGGKVVTPEGVRDADVWIESGTIVRIEDRISPREGTTVLSVEGKVVLPGMIDPHVHFRTPGEEYKEDWETGSRAALAGGVTTVLDMPNNTPPITTRSLWEAKRSLVASKALVRYGLYMGATFDPITGHTNVEEFLSSEAVALKVYMGSSTGSLLVHQSEALEELFQRVGETDRVICVHAEDHALLEQRMAEYAGTEDPTLHPLIRSEAVALAAVRRAFELSKRHGTRVHLCHMTTEAELKLFREFRSDRISCEVSPHHLFLDSSEYDKQGNFAKMNPPLRSSDNRFALLHALANGEISMVATDHAPHTRAEKEKPYSQAPSGVPGLETALPLLLNAVNEGHLSLEMLAQVSAAHAANVFGLNDRGRIEVGASADLVVVDMDVRRTVENGEAGARYTKCGWSPFEGRLLQGWPVLTLVQGEIRMRDAEVLV